MCVCVCVCVCVCQKERGGEGGWKRRERKKRGKTRERERESSKLTHFIAAYRDLPMDYTFSGGAESYASHQSPSPPPMFDMLSEKKAKDSGKS